MDRAYLRAVSASVVMTEGLVYTREGPRAHVQAQGTHAGLPYTLRWALTDGQPCLYAATPTRGWEPLPSPDVDGLRTWLATLPR